MEHLIPYFLLVTGLGTAVGVVGGLRLAFNLAGIALIAVCLSFFSPGYGFFAGMLYLLYAALPYTGGAALGSLIRRLRTQKRR